MKQIMMLLLAAGAFTTTFAQSRGERSYEKNVVLGRSNSHDAYGRNDNRYEDRNSFGKRDCDAQIQNIYRSFDARIWNVKNERHLRSAEKRRIIRNLEEERAVAIRRVSDRYAQRNDRRY